MLAATDSNARGRSGFAARRWLVFLMLVGAALHAAHARWAASANRLALAGAGSPREAAGGIPEAEGFAFVGDESDYYLIAWNLSSGRGFSQSRPEDPAEPTAYRSPLYPVILAGLFRFVGPDPEAGIVLNRVLAVLVIPLAYGLGRALHDARAGLLAAALATLWPHGYLFAGSLMTESLAAFAGTGMMLLLVRLTLRPSIAAAAGAGLAAGLAGLARSSFFVPVALLIPWFLGRLRTTGGWRGSAVFAGAFSVVVLPWVVRNVAVFGLPIAGTTGGGDVFAGAHSPETVAAYPGGWMPPDLDRGGISEVDRDARAWRRGLDDVRSLDAGALFRLGVLKLARFWVPVQRVVFDSVCPACNLVASAIYLPAVVLAVVGFFDLRRRPSLFAVVALVLVGLNALTVVFWGGTRLRAPLEPFFWGLSGYAAVAVLESKRRPAAAPKRKVY
jgi:4-amino-4-deoxy-L-arabinose transferase-like glycosyltransferase